MFSGGSNPSPNVKTFMVSRAGMNVLTLGVLLQSLRYPNLKPYDIQIPIPNHGKLKRCIPYPCLRVLDGDNVYKM